MKKNYVLLSISLLLHFHCLYAQDRLHFGARFSPSVAWNRVTPERFVEVNGTEYNFVASPASIRWGLGMYVDYMFMDNFGISTGLNFMTNSSGVVQKTRSSAGISSENITRFQTSYLQIPLGFKIITNEIFDRGKLYFMPGITLDILLEARINDKADFQRTPGAAVEKYYSFFNPLASHVFFSKGVEYELTGNLKATAGLSYYHGITDMDNSNSGLKAITNKSYALYSNFIGLDLGIRF